MYSLVGRPRVVNLHTCFLGCLLALSDRKRARHGLITFTGYVVSLPTEKLRDRGGSPGDLHTSTAQPQPWRPQQNPAKNKRTAVSRTDTRHHTKEQRYRGSVSLNRREEWKTIHESEKRQESGEPDEAEL